jgi:hypothetical protein
MKESPGLGRDVWLGLNRPERSPMTLMNREPSTFKHTRGRALFIDMNDRLYISRGYQIFRSDDGGENWILDCQVPIGGCRSWLAKLPLAARASRNYVQALRVDLDGARLVVARDGIYRAELGEIQMNRVWMVKRGSRPLNLSVDGHRILFGEYGGDCMTQVRVGIICSEDGGRTFRTVHEFEKGDIQHVHNIIVDPHSDHYWLLAGDHGNEPGIAALSKDFGKLEWVGRGDQMLRAVQVLPHPDGLIYGSDSEVEQNHIVKLDRISWRYERVAPLDGSSIYAADFGRFSLISTCVEASSVNTGKVCSLYESSDGTRWNRALSMRKDIWQNTIFQFGLIVLPYVMSKNPVYGMFSGQAVVGNHDQVSIFKL